MSLWKKISLGVLIFIVLLLGTVAFLVGTTTGLHLLFNAANRWVPGLEIGQVTGGWRDLRLKNIRYEQPGVAVNAGEFHLAVKLRVGRSCVVATAIDCSGYSAGARNVFSASLSK